MRYVVLVGLVLLTVDMGLMWAWWLLSFLGVRVGKDVLPSREEFRDSLDVIVVMCAMNGAGYIRQCVEKWVQQSGVLRVVVITDGSVDDTDKEVRLGGGQVLHCGKSQKAEKMRYMANMCVADRYVVYVFVDQGSEPGSRCCAYRLAYSAFMVRGPVQGERRGKGGSWLQDAIAVDRSTVWAVVQSGRCRMGASAMMAGTGWAIPGDVLSRTDFPTFSVTEDLAYSVQLAGEGVRVPFLEDVVILDNLPYSWRVLWRQRVRWGRGTLQVVFSKLMLPAMVGREWGIGWWVVGSQVIALIIVGLLVMTALTVPFALVGWLEAMIILGSVFSVAGAVRTRRWRGIVMFLPMWFLNLGAFVVALCSWRVHTWIATVYRRI